jgi:D-glycero-alpha-D-manno-heptose-7-phosphate kinase
MPGKETRTPVRINPAELENRLVLCYTGKPRKSGINNWKVFKAQIEGDLRVSRNLEKIRQIAVDMVAQLTQQKWNDVGQLMREEWTYRRRNLPTISTPTIDRIIADSRQAGALGGKVCGAGGGGCVALLIEPEARVRVEAAVQNAGGQVLPFRIDRRGVRVHVVR